MTSSKLTSKPTLTPKFGFDSPFDPGITALNIIGQLNKWAEISKTFDKVNSLRSLQGAIGQIQSQLPEEGVIVAHVREVEKGRWIVDKLSTPPTIGPQLDPALDSAELGQGSMLLKGSPGTECKIPGMTRSTIGYTATDEKGQQVRIWVDEKAPKEPSIEGTPPPSRPGAPVLLPPVQQTPSTPTQERPRTPIPQDTFEGQVPLPGGWKG